MLLIFEHSAEQNLTWGVENDTTKILRIKKDQKQIEEQKKINYCIKYKMQVVKVTIRLLFECFLIKIKRKKRF